MEIKKDWSGRIIVNSNKPFGKHGWKSNGVQLKELKSGNFITINKQKINIKELKQIEDFWNNSEYVSQFYYEQ